MKTTEKMENNVFIKVESFNNINSKIVKQNINLKCLTASLTRKGYNGMPLHVMEQPPRFFALAYRASDACIYQ